MSSNSRREFFKNILGLAGVAVLAPALFSNTAKAEGRKRAKPAAELADPNKDVAKALGYKHKSDQPAKLCSNCFHYVADVKKYGDEVGECAIIPGKVVKAAGYCNSWMKKV